MNNIYFNVSVANTSALFNKNGTIHDPANVYGRKKVNILMINLIITIGLDCCCQTYLFHFLLPSSLCLHAQFYPHPHQNFLLGMMTHSSSLVNLQYWQYHLLLHHYIFHFINSFYFWPTHDVFCLGMVQKMKGILTLPTCPTIVPHVVLVPFWLFNNLLNATMQN